MDWLRKAFSAGMDASRANPAGIILMAASVLLAALAGKLAEMLKPDSPDQMKGAIKIIALVICAGGALLAILG